MKPLVLISIIIAIISSGCRHATVKPAEAELTNVRMVLLDPDTISIPIHSSGILVSSEEMKLSFKTGGIVAEILVSEGSRVKKGETLALLNLSEINAQVSLAMNGFDKASRDFTRAKNLYTDSVATLEQMQNATTALNVARSTLEIAQFNLKHSKIIAPENGVILKQFVKANELISSGYPVLLFGSSGRNWKVKTGLSDRDIIRINQGDSAFVTLDAWQGVRFPAIVEQVGEMSNPLTGTYEIELILNKTDYRLATGFIAEAEIFPSRKEIFVMVPVGAIVDADGQSGYIFSLSNSLIAQKNRVEIVTIQGSKAAIKGNFAGIREIVSEGAAYLKDGMSVRVVR